MSEPLESKSRLAIRNLFDADHPLIYIQSPEENRVIALLDQVAQQQRPAGKLDLFVWSVTDGLQRNGQAVKPQPDGPRGVLDFIIAHGKPAVFLLRDFHEFIRESAEIRRRLRDVYSTCLATGKFAVISSPVKFIPDEIDRELAFLKLPLPDLVELEELVRSEAGALGTAEPPQEQTVYVLSRALQGLSLNEAHHALRLAATTHGRLDPTILPTLQHEKQILVRKGGLLEYVPETAGIDQVGGLDIMKRWLEQRRDLFYSRESISAEIVPKGVLMTGVSGCGKSLSSRAIAAVFGLPLYRVEMSQVFAAGLGNAERLFADACRTMEEVAPAVVWFDEIENSISRAHQDSSGVLDRIFGYFLTWMQEKPVGLFVAATANRIDLLPAELIRKGRFDQVFFIDLPDIKEREEILRIHLSKRDVDPDGVSMDYATKRTEDWTGAEIEQCVISAMTAARLANQPLGDNHLFPALKEIVPLAKTMKEQVEYIRGWAYDRAIRASTRRH